jgi:transcriptional regulator of acetoin/glycerol metabolism
MAGRALLPRSPMEFAAVGTELEDDLRRLRAARERFLSLGELTSGLRPVIQRSWPRGMQFGVAPDARRLDMLVSPRLEARLQRAAEPVLSGLDILVQSTKAAVILADSDGTVVDVRGEADVQRRLETVYPVPGGVLSEDLAGTNAVGTAIEEGIGVQVWSGEHLVEAFQGFFCTAIPIRDPLSTRVLAVLDLTVRDEDVSPHVAKLLARIVMDAAAQVERTLAEQLAAREQALLFHYLQELRKRYAVIAFDGRTTIASQGALAILEQGDLAALLAYGEESIRGQHALERQVMLTSGRAVQLVASPKFDGGECIGTIVRLKTLSEDPPRPSARPVALQAERSAFGLLVGQNRAFRQALDLAATALERGLAAYLYGEPGTGKYALAQAMAHSSGGVAATVDCEAADMRGHAWADNLRRQLAGAEVVILRHVDALRPAGQRALAALLDDPTLHPLPRLLATAQRAAPRSGLVSSLLQRLALLQVRLPPLRERREDVPLLVQALLDAEHAPRRARVSPAAMQALVQADWPANVRQLRHVLHSALAVARGREIGVADLSEQLLAASKRPRLSRLEEAELEELRRALHEARGNRARAAVLLGIGRSTLYRKLDTYRLKGFNPLP